MSIDRLPVISIITPCLNRVNFICESINSVLQQNGVQVEHLIIDGVSIDGTLSKLYSFPHLKILSEPDEGIYDAINKGITLSKGKIIGLLNTDDLYEPEIFARVVSAFNENPFTDAIIGSSTIFRGLPGESRQQIAFYPPITRKNLLFEITQGKSVINAWFFRREVFEKVGLFDIRYKYAADRDFLIRFALEGCQFMPIQEVLYHYRHHAGSATINEFSDAETAFVFENRAIAEDYLMNHDLSPVVRKYFRDWHSQVSCDQTLFALKYLKIEHAIRYALCGLQFDATWPLKFAREAISSVKRIAHRALGHNPTPFYN